MPSYTWSKLVLLFPLETLLTLLQSTQLLKWEPGSLVSTGEAAHPAVTSMGSWYKLGKQMPIVCIVGEGLVCPRLHL